MYDYYGGDDKLYATCVLALDGPNGDILSDFQVIRHEIWDCDLSAQPVLCDIGRNGRPIQAVAQVSKLRFVYVLEERPEPQPASCVSGPCPHS